MSPHFLIRTLALAVGLAGISPLMAQEVAEPDPAAKERIEAQGFRLPPQLRKIDYRDANPWVLHANARYANTESTVTFGNIGNVPSIRNLPGADQTVELRRYDDGGVAVDAPRAPESDEDGNQTSTPGGRYQTFDDNDQLTGDFLAYTVGQTREWAYLNDSQASNGTIAMHAFGAESAGASLHRDIEGSGLGFELAVSRRLLSLGKRTELSFSGNIGLTDFSAAASGRVGANLITLTDVYNVFGEAPAADYFAPSFEILFDEIGNTISELGRENTVPLQQVTPDRSIVTTPGAANVDGTWDIDGAYYSIRLGAELRHHFTDRIAVTFGGGVLGTFVGSDFTVTEQLDLEDYNTFGMVSVTDSLTSQELLNGFYAEASFEYWLSQRTGLFVGAAWESMSDFIQTVGGRTASVLLGDSLVVRIGLVTRF